MMKTGSGALALAFALAFALVFSGCASRGPAVPEPEPVFSGANSVIVPPITYGTTDAGTVLTDADDGCDIPGLLATGLQDNLSEPYLHVLRDNTRGVDGAPTLMLQVTDILANGGGQFSGPKIVEIKGSLWKGGTRTASFRARRVSFPLFGPPRSTCNMVGRAVYGLGYDAATWLLNPLDGAVLGDR